MKMKQFIGTCVTNPFGTKEALDKVIEKARRITRQKFLSECDVPPNVSKDMYRMTTDYEFYRHEDVCFYRHSATEHFYR